MGKVIDSENTSAYKIERFEFKPLAEDREVEYNDITSIFGTNKELDKDEKEPELESQVIESNNEELLKKIDLLSSEVVSLQMKIEENEKEYEKELISVKDSSYEEGVKSAVSDSMGEVEDLKIQYISSITKLQESGIEIQSKLDNIENELIETSIAIAKKVIIKELEESSSLVAKAISGHLINELRDFGGVKLVVNPIDYEDILQSFEPKGITIQKDSSITKGGVMLYHESKNIDSTVETRFKRALALIKES